MHRIQQIISLAQSAMLSTLRCSAHCSCPFFDLFLVSQYCYYAPPLPFTLELCTHAVALKLCAQQRAAKLSSMLRTMSTGARPGAAPTGSTAGLDLSIAARAAGRHGKSHLVFRVYGARAQPEGRSRPPRRPRAVRGTKARGRRAGGRRGDGERAAPAS